MATPEERRMLKKAIDDLLEDQETRVTVSTIHKDSHSYETCIIELVPIGKLVRIRVDTMVQSVRVGECTMKDIARTIIELWCAALKYGAYGDFVTIGY